MRSEPQRRRPTVCFPSDLDQAEAAAGLWGYHHPSTNHYVVLDPARRLTDCRNLNDSPDIPPLLAHPGESGLWFTAGGRHCTLKPYDRHSDLFSRHAGLVESDHMQRCGVIVCGCGSVGALAAVDLARSGVGRFLLVDDDLLGIENLCRHPCGIADVGRAKVDAVADRIRQVNPWAEVEVHPCTIERIDPAVMAAFTAGQGPSLLLACADSRRADRHGARLAAALKIPFLSIGLWERAFAGEIFHWLPGASHPCYLCAFDGLAGELSRRPEPQRRLYTTETELGRVQRQPALAIDIALVTQVGLKLAVDLLHLDVPGHVSRLLGHVSPYTLVCNSNDPRLGGEAAEIFSYPLQVTTSLQPSHGLGCPPCRLQC
jgi:molybdopterin/thiamine biosynthesis adenylyltransferase